MEFIILRISKDAFTEVMDKLKTENEIHSFGFIDFDNVENEPDKIKAIVQNSFINRLSPEQLFELRAIEIAH